MDGEADVADVGPVDQSRGDHPPADRALQRAQCEKPAEPPAIAGRNRPAQREPGERKREGEADQPAEQAVDIFPEIDVLELAQSHAAVDQLELRSLAVGVELGAPGLVVERRDRAGHRLPAGDRQAGLGEPGYPADDHDQKHQRCDEEQPVRHSERAGRSRGPGKGKIDLGRHGRRYGGSRRGFQPSRASPGPARPSTFRAII